MENKKRKQVDSIHLIYISIILVGIIVLLLAFIFKSSSYAGELLNFAATLSSILLAVIAIVITLIDVAGQRNNIFDVKNSVENLKEVSHEIEIMIKNFNEQNENNIKSIMSDFQKFTEQQNEIKIGVDGLMKKIESLPADDKNIKEIKEEANKVKSIMQNSSEAITLFPGSIVKIDENWQPSFKLSDVQKKIDVPTTIKSNNIEIKNKP